MRIDKRQLTGIINGSPVYASEFVENKFPFKEVYPATLIDIIRELREKYGFPEEYSGASVLMAFATASGSTFKLMFKNDFPVTPNIYCILVGDPGACKSHPLKFMFKPIEKRQAEYYKEYQLELEEYNTYEKMSKKEKEELEPVEKPRLKINTIDNYTLESFLKRLSENPRGITITVDELNSYFENMNRYNSGSDGETYNTLWSGGDVKVSRVSSEPIYVPPTAVSIFGTIQPAILQNVFSKDKDKNGLTARFLFVMPENLEPIKWTLEEIDEVLIEKYHQAIFELLDVELQFNENGEPEPTILKFTDEALNRIIEWRNGHEYRGKIIEEKGHTYFEAFLKLDNYALRFALILQIMYASFENEPLDKVGIRAVENAILLVNYFMKEVIKVHRLIYERDIRLQMSEKQREVYEILPPVFYINQIYDKVLKLGFTRDQMKKFVGIPKYFTRIGRGNYKKNFFELSDD